MRTIIIGIAFVLASLSVVAQGWGDDKPFDRDKMRQRVEDVRKMKLLDLLDLKDDQVEKFFAAYTKHQKRILELRDEVEKSAKDLQAQLKKGASDAELIASTTEVRKLIKEVEQQIEARFDAVKPVLTTKQYAIYVVFEARFYDELQKMIVERVRRNKKD